MNDQARCNATATLRREHDSILAVVEVLERAIKPPRDGSILDDCDLAPCIVYLRAFADLCHHNKEEKVLFPALVAAGLPERGGPVAVMLHEHDQGRSLVRTMAEAEVDARNGHQAAEQQLIGAAKAFVDLIRDHILKENNILFEMADRLIPAEIHRSMNESYDELDAGFFDGHSKASLELMVSQLQAH